MFVYPFTVISMAPSDPILGLTESFNADTDRNKVNLAQGVYCNEDGNVPLLECVRRAEEIILDRATPHSYLPIDGLHGYSREVQEILFGKENEVVRQERVVTVQALGGTGALRVGADFLRSLNLAGHVWISDPSWENHRALFECAGFKVNTYPYYEPSTHRINFDGMLDSMERLPAGSILVLHACCHNPTGLDLSAEQWKQVIKVINTRGLVPFIDNAYQGFAEGLEKDAAVLRDFAEGCPVLLIASSFSKSLSLYGERVGALSIITENADQAARTLSHLKRLIRVTYSNPPSYGGRVAEVVLTTSELKQLWHKELGQMRDRIKKMRHELLQNIRSLRPDYDFSFMIEQRGMFSYSGLTKAQAHRLREEYAVYVLDSGRICVAALNPRNVDYVANAIARVLI